MSYASVCPHLMFSFDELKVNTTPEEIEANRILPLIDIIDELTNIDVDIKFSEELLSRIMDTFPWNFEGDEYTRQYVLTWWKLVFPRVSRFQLHQHKVVDDAENLCDLCEPDLGKIFQSFLSEFQNALMRGGKHPECIVCNDFCFQSYSGPGYGTIQSKSDAILAKYPWLRCIDRRLPVEGAMQFIPPRNWKLTEAPHRADDYGYLDDFGNSWKWDRLHKDHWDVTLKRDRKHLNVTTLGEILNP